MYGYFETIFWTDLILYPAGVLLPVDTIGIPPFSIVLFFKARVKKE